MITQKRFLVLALAIVASVLSVSVIVGWNLHHQPQRSSAAWKVKFGSQFELVKGVDVVALATATSTRPGRIAYSENREDALPFEVTQFRVVRAIKGVSEGEKVFVERAGGITPECIAVHLDADGGEFVPGTTYLLFLKQQEDGGSYHYQVNDQGRYEVVGKRLRAVDPDDPVAATFNGRPVDEMLRIVKHTHEKMPTN